VFRVVAVGRFDGVHLGHQRLLSFGRELAEKKGWSFLAYTFPPEPPALLPLPVKIRLLRQFASEVEVVEWEKVRNLSPQEFLEKEVLERLSGRALVMGMDHRFGRDRAGDPELAKKLGKELGLEIQVVPPLSLGGEIVSSRRIRELVSLGEVERAGELLGRPPVLFGRGIKGLGMGKTLGFPTINLELDPLLVRPREGIYMAWAFWPNGNGPALFYHGKRPTFPGLPPSTELHLLSPPPPALPEVLEVHLLRFLRADTRFPSAEALVQRIKQDVDEAKKALAMIRPPAPLSPWL
jgi:riboflavin kinase/FMN adenylyltransferase